MSKLLLPSRKIVTPRASRRAWERHGSRPWEFLPKWLLQQPLLMNKYSPGAGCVCCGGDTCTLLNDGFDRADSTNLGSNWTEGGGSINLEISSGSVIRVSGNPTYAISTVTHSSGDIRVTMAVTAPTAGSKFRIIFDFVDLDNYVFAEFTTGFSGAGARIWQRVGGTETALSGLVSIPASGSFSWDACMRGPYVSAGSGLSARAHGLWTAGNGTFGIGFGSTTSGMKIDSILAQKVEEGCDVCVGSTCVGTCSADYPLPLQVQVTISGMANISPTPVCTDCASLNGTFVLDPRWNAPCWFCGVFDSICGTCPFEVILLLQDLTPSPPNIPGVGGITVWQGLLDLTSEGDCPPCTGRGFVTPFQQAWSGNLGPNANCSSFTNVPLTDATGGTGIRCDGNASSATATAL